MPLTSESPLPRYQDYRARFLSLVQKSGLILKHEKIEKKGPFGEDLVQDYALWDNKAPVTLVAITGVHGTEGYFGSDILAQLLARPLPDSKKTNIILVHSVNPFGMAWYRRANFDNVDLNRNCTDHQKAKSIETGYEKFLSFLRSKNSMELIRRFPAAMIKAALLGPDATTRAIASGQFRYPDSLFYGGEETEPEVQSLLQTLSQLAPQTQIWVFLDYHTGLGPWAEESRIRDDSQNASERDFFRKAFQAELLEPESTSGFYLPTGILGTGLKKFLPGKNKYSITLEYGTLHFLQVISNLILENGHFLHQPGHFSKSIAKKMLRTFYPAAPDWRQTCVNLGVERFYQALKATEGS